MPKPWPPFESMCVSTGSIASVYALSIWTLVFDGGTAVWSPAWTGNSGGAGKSGLATGPAVSVTPTVTHPPAGNPMIPIRCGLSFHCDARFLTKRTAARSHDHRRSVGPPGRRQVRDQHRLDDVAHPPDAVLRPGIFRFTVRPRLRRRRRAWIERNDPRPRGGNGRQQGEQSENLHGAGNTITAAAIGIVYTVREETPARHRYPG
ncbi:MAG: hypothetical protein C0504_05855 [Candidatus Solibacter sp.]|nr:hypothetical protein [Candidatus Solibacter sp.]